MANLITGYTVSTNTHNAYLAPEQLYVCLRGGEVESRGRLVQTGWLLSLSGSEAAGFVVQSLSGSVYELGTPAEGTAAEAAEAIREALSRVQPGEAAGYHPATLRHILALSD